MRKNKLITKEELSELSGIKIKEIIKYVKADILSYEKEDEKLNRFYNKKKASNRLKEIKRLEEEGHDLSKIKEYFKPSYEEEMKDLLKN